MSKDKKLSIRNSTAEFLIFTRQAGEEGIEVRVAEETVWLTQKLMAALFEVDVRTVSEHLGNIFASGEQKEDSVIRKFRTTANDGKNYQTQFYNLDAIIAVGFRVNSARATQFRQWATGVLRDFAIRGYVLDKERLKNGAFLSKEYYDNLLGEIREIRASERRFYQKITDIYATAMDYSVEAETTQTFFATVQNKLHFAIHGHTASELIVERADSKKERMGLTTWKRAPHGKILKPDVVVAKNYLKEKELKSLDRIVTMYLDYAEDQTEHQSTGGQLGKPASARRRVYERLKDYAAQVKDSLFDIKPLHQAIDAIYEAPLTEAARDLLNREMKSGIDNNKLSELVLSLHEEDRLCVPQDDVEAREPKIICSLGIRKD